MSYYEGTLVDRLPQELIERIGFPEPVGHLLALPFDVIDRIYSTARDSLVTSIQRVFRGYRTRWSFAPGENRRYYADRYSLLQVRRSRRRAFAFTATPAQPLTNPFA